MHDKAILIASFGTSCDETRERNVGAVERAVAQRFPNHLCRRAFTSGMIRKKLQARGIAVHSVTEALRELSTAGVKTVTVLPTHLIYGEEYDKLCREVRMQKTVFESVCVAKPLLASYEEIHAVLAAIDDGIARAEDEALVLMGHGTEHPCNYIYAAMDYYAKDIGMRACFIGTVEAYPSIDTITAALKAGGWKRAVLAPLMLVAGDHAQNDMAGEEDSWLCHLRAEGIEARAVLRGLGEYEAVRALYCAHVQEAL